MQVIDGRHKSNSVKVIIAFAVIYTVWGSTYIAIKFALESLPPLLMVAVRFFSAGAIMYVWMRLRGAARPEPAHIVSTSILGVLLLVFGSSGVVMAEKTVPSGIVSLLVVTVPVFIVLLQWLQSGKAPNWRVVLGLMIGTLGLIFLLDPSKIASKQGVDLLGISYVLIGSLGSAAGAIYSGKANLPSSRALAVGMEMVAAGLVLFILSGLSGEFSFFQHAHASIRSLLALLYLMIFGSMIAFTAYVWLLSEVSPSRVSTYAYVNPVVAVFLGWWLAGEKVDWHTVIGAVVMIGAVWLINHSKA